MKKLLIIAIIFWTNFVLNAQTNTTGFGQQNMYISPITAEIQAILDKSDSLVNSAKINAFFNLISGLGNDSLKIIGADGVWFSDTPTPTNASGNMTFLFSTSSENLWGGVLFENSYSADMQIKDVGSLVLGAQFQANVKSDYVGEYGYLSGGRFAVYTSSDSDAYPKDNNAIWGFQANIGINDPYIPTSANSFYLIRGVECYMDFNTTDTLTVGGGGLNFFTARGGTNTVPLINSDINMYYSYPDFYQSISSKMKAGKRIYHFNGVGDFPIKTGGTYISKVYTTDVSNPPTDAELDAAFPNAEIGETIKINDAGNGTDLYEVTLIATGVWGIVEMTVAL